MPRALTNQEIQIKEMFILRNAFNLFEENTFKSFRMDDLAKLCGMSKGILFKYFRSKEMLFMKMLELEYEKMYNSLDKALIRHNEMSKVEFKELVVNQFSNSLDPTSHLLRLVELKSSVLESNIDYDFAVKNKTKINDMLLELVQNTLLKVNGLSFDTIRAIYDTQRILANGFISNFVKRGIVKNAIEDANLDMFTVDYKELSITIFKAYLKDL